MEFCTKLKALWACGNVSPTNFNEYQAWNREDNNLNKVIKQTQWKKLLKIEIKYHSKMSGDVYLQGKNDQETHYINNAYRPEQNTMRSEFFSVVGI